MCERDNEKNKRYRVKITGSEKNKDEACGIIMDSQDGAGMLPDEIYSINGLQLKALKRAKIKYKEVN